MSFAPASSLSPSTVVVGGTVAVSNFPASQPVTGPLTDAQLRAAAVPVSGTVAVSAVGGTVTVDGSGHTQPVSGTVGVSNFPATQPVSGTVAVSAVGGTVTVDGSGHTQPVSGSVSATVSGTVTANQGTAGTAWPISAATLPLPSGAAKDSTLTDGTLRVGGTVTTSGTVSGTVAVSTVGGTVTTDGSGHTQPVSGTVAVSGVSGTVTVDGSAVTQPVSAESLPLPDGAATEDTLAHVNGGMQDVALTAVLDRNRLEVNG